MMAVRKDFQFSLQIIIAPRRRSAKLEVKLTKEKL